MSSKEFQLDLFSKDKNDFKKNQVIQTVDQINTHFGKKVMSKKVMSFAGEGIEKNGKVFRRCVLQTTPLVGKRFHLLSSTLIKRRARKVYE